MTARRRQRRARRNTRVRPSNPLLRRILTVRAQLYPSGSEWSQAFAAIPWPPNCKLGGRNPAGSPQFAQWFPEEGTLGGLADDPDAALLQPRKSGPPTPLLMVLSKA